MIAQVEDAFRPTVHFPAEYWDGKWGKYKLRKGPEFPTPFHSAIILSQQKWCCKDSIVMEEKNHHSFTHDHQTTESAIKLTN